MPSRESNRVNNRRVNPASVWKKLKKNGTAESIQKPQREKLVGNLTSNWKESNINQKEVHYTGKFSIEFYPHKEWRCISLPENAGVDDNNIMSMDHGTISKTTSGFDIYEANGDIVFDTKYTFVKAVKDAKWNILWENGKERKKPE